MKASLIALALVAGFGLSACDKTSKSTTTVETKTDGASAPTPVIVTPAASAASN